MQYLLPVFFIPLLITNLVKYNKITKSHGIGVINVQSDFYLIMIN